MKYIKFLFSLILVLGTFYGLNTKFGSIPPLGKFLDPSSGIWQNDTSENDTNTINIEGLLDEVTVHYDQYLIPHIFAKNELDLYKAQGYITAKHRLWQMEFQTHAAAGRISEIVGVDALDYDRAQRRKGMSYGADNSLKKIKEDPEIFDLLEAYRDGINSYINQLKPKDFPVEYKLLDYAPELWTVKKTSLLLMYMTDMLAGFDNDLEYTNLLRKLGKERFDLLFPDFYDVNDPVIPKERDWSSWNVTVPEIPNGSFPLDTISDVMTKPHPDNGSNNWAVSGSKSYSGNPILANDPHLGLKLPSIWFAMQLATPEKNTFGVTLPGAFGIIIGFNNDISWGFTNATRDVRDWYKIIFEDNSKKRYYHDNRWKETSIKIENIKIRGQETYVDSVYYTHHGPVSYDNTFKGKHQLSGYAMQWTGHLGSNIERTFLELNEATNYDDYKNALKYWVAPAQNFIFSSTEGDIALWVQGKFPNKWKGQGKFLMDGSNPEHDWQSFIPQQHNAHILNPKQGFLSSANQHPADESYPYYVFNDGFEIYRNRVINNFFRSKDKFNIQDFKDLHNNNYNLKAAELLPTMIASMDISELTDKELQIFNEVKLWDYYNDIDKLGPAIWEQWYSKLFWLTWDEFDVKDGDVAIQPPYNYQTIYMLNHYPNNEFMDIKETKKKETAVDLYKLSFKEAAEDLSKWKEENGDYSWGKYKGTYIGHLLQALPAFSRFNLPIGGNGNSVNATSKNHGPSWRMIVEMSSTPKAVGVYPGGQSGNPGSKHYDDFVDTWVNGNYFKLLFMQNDTETEEIVQTQTLRPKS